MRQTELGSDTYIAALSRRFDSQPGIRTEEIPDSLQPPFEAMRSQVKPPEELTWRFFGREDLGTDLKILPTDQ